MVVKRICKILPAVLLGVVLGGCGGSGGAPPQQVLSLSQTMLTFNAAFGGSNPAAVSVNVTNTGPGTLSFTVVSDSAWLSVTPASGSAPQSLEISAMLGNLSSGNYTGHVTLTAGGAQGSPATITVGFAVGGPPPSNAAFWPQWGANPQHTGMVAVAGQSTTNQLADIVYDPFTQQEEAENQPAFGAPTLLAHFQAPIVDGNDVYMTTKTGTYESCNPPGTWVNGARCGPNTWNTLIWNETRFSWENGQLVKIWSFASDWKPEPNGIDLYGWEPVFHPVDANSFIYAPGAGGTVWKVNKTDGTAASHINPFSGVQISPQNTYVSGPLTADPHGNIYYNVIELTDPSQGDWGNNDVLGAWLVKVTPQDTLAIVSYAIIVPNAPAPNWQTCPGTFLATDPNGTQLPWPPPSPTNPPPQLCGSPRPGINIAPAVAADGTIYTASVAQFDPLSTFLVAVNSDLTPKWSTPMLNLLNDGCGVLVPISGPANNQPNSCRNGTTVGVDPRTNAMGNGEIVDQASSSLSVALDGSILFGSLGGYGARGHLLQFGAQGNFLASYDFGWDETPAVYAHNGTYSIVIKDNHYGGVGLYCNFNNPICQPLQNGPYYVTQLNSNLQIEWQFQNTNTKSCDRNPDGSLSCVSDHPNGFEWCTNMPAIDSNGTVYVNSEDGNLYELAQGQSGIFTQPQGSLFLNLALGAAYTPLSIGPDGKLYTENNGNLFVVGN
jgi:hypothetical protein